MGTHVPIIEAILGHRPPRLVRTYQVHAPVGEMRAALEEEDFGAVPTTPQRACLAGVRAADVFLLLIGGRYGSPQASGLSPTHEEFRDAQLRGTVLVFVQQGVDREDAQEAFLQEVRSWDSGLCTASFTTPDDLRDVVTAALHQLELARAVGPIDAAEMLARAKEALERHQGGFGQATLKLVVVGAPAQQILRPAELERPELAREIKQQALFGPATIFETESGTKESITGDHLELRQDHRSLTLDQLGTVSIEMPAEEHHEGSHLPVLVEEFIAQQVEAALSFAGWLLDRVDSTHRLQEVAPVLSLFEGGYLGWKTRAEHRKNPDVVSMGIGMRDDLTAQLHPPTRRREALRSDVKRLAEDLRWRFLDMVGGRPLGPREPIGDTLGSPEPLVLLRCTTGRGTIDYGVETIHRTASKRRSGNGARQRWSIRP
jgi:hypothetical protein